MFDLRYHVASLAAVFLALVLGIAVGAALSDPGLGEQAERDNLRRQLDAANRALDEANRRAENAEAAVALNRAGYGALVANRLVGRRLLLVSVGPPGEELAEAGEAISMAGGDVQRTLALQMPQEAAEVDRALRARPALRGYVGRDRLQNVGRDFARELVDGEETPLGDALGTVLVQRREGSSRGRVDGVVLARSASPQHGPLALLVRGLYEGLRGVVPAVGVELSAAPVSAVPAFDRAELSTVNAVDTVLGKVALVVVLAGGRPGNYGVVDGAASVPHIEPLPAPPAGDGASP